MANKKSKIIDFNSKKEVDEIEVVDNIQVSESVEATETQEVSEEDEVRQQIQKLNPDQKKVLIAEYNRNNEGVCEIEDTDEPVSEEWIESCKKDFEAVVEEANNIPFVIADKDKAMETAVFVADWNANKNHWHRAYWKGVIKFNEFIEEKIDLLEKGEIETLEFDYPALIFLYQSMMSPQGIGLLEAQEMEAIDEQYNAILDVLGTYVDQLQNYDKKAKLYQERWGLACNGFKMNILIEDIEDFANVDLSQRQG